MDKKAYKDDMWLGIGVIILGIIYGCLIPFQVSGQSESMGVSPLISGRTLPVIVAVALVCLGGILAVTSNRECKECLIEDTSGISVAEKKARAKRTITYIAVIIIYLISISLISFIFASVFFLLFAIWFSGCTNKVAIVLSALLSPIIVYILFSEVMMMPMPDSYLVEFLQNTFDLDIAI